MIANHIHDALGQVRRLQEVLLSRRLFQGYSGKARIASGFAALAGAMILDSGRIPNSPWTHLAGWGAVLAIGVALNYLSLAYWFLFDPKVRRQPVMLKPAMDALPALAVGGAISAALISIGEFELLFGIWMSCYGLAQVAYRQTLPRGIYAVGLFYILCGVFCLAWPSLSFTNPWPMGIVFFIGEQLGGIVLIANRMADVHEVHQQGEPDR